MQMSLPIAGGDNEVNSADFPLTANGSPASEVARLTALLVEVELQATRYNEVRRRIGTAIRNQRERAASLAAQIESIERNPLAILRYRSRVPGWDQSTAWYNQPVDSLRLCGVKGLGGARLRILIDLCPTIGDLEQQRIHDGLTRLTGIGDQIARRIERRLLDWLASNAPGYQPKPSYEDWQRPEKEPFPAVISADDID